MYALTLEELLNQTKEIILPNTGTKLFLDRKDDNILQFRGGGHGFSAKSNQKVLVRDGTTIVPLVTVDDEIIYPRFKLFGDEQGKTELLAKHKVTTAEYLIERPLLELYNTHSKITDITTKSTVKSINIIRQGTRSIIAAFTLITIYPGPEVIRYFNFTSEVVNFSPLNGTVSLISEQGTLHTFLFEEFITEDEQPGAVRTLVRLSGESFEGKELGDFYPTPFQEMMHADLMRKLVGLDKVFYMFGPGSSDTADMVQIQTNSHAVIVLKMYGPGKVMKSIPFTDRSQAIWFYIMSLFEMVE